MENNMLNSKRKSFGLYEAALATILFIVFNSVYLFLYRFLPYDFRKIDAVTKVATFLLEALFAVTAYVVATAKKVDFIKASGLNKKVNGNIVFYGVLISFFSLFFFGNLTNVFIEFLYYFGYSSILGGIEIPNFGVYLVYVVVSCVTPALAEEILFRGAIASGLKEKGFKVALIFSSLIFMLMHGGPEQTVHQFIVGIVVGYMFLKTGNIWLGVIVHFFNNFISVTQAYLLTIYANSSESTGEVAAETAETATGLGSLFMSLIVAIIMAMIGYIVVKKLIDKICAESDRINAPAPENATIKVDDAEVAVEMAIDGEVLEVQENNSNEESLEQNVVSSEKNEKTKVSLAIAVMFAVSGAYFVIEWLLALFTGLGIV